MPRFAHIFEAAADTLNAYYQAVAEVNIDSLMGLWIDEEFVSCICADGSPLPPRTTSDFSSAIASMVDRSSIFPASPHSPPR